MKARLFTRLMFRSREVYALKVLTLAVAFAAFIIIVRFSQLQFNYDQFNEQPEKVFRVLQRNEASDYHGNRWSALIPAAVSDRLRHAYADSLATARVKVMRNVNVRAGRRIFADHKLHAVEVSIINIFNFKILHGEIDNFKKAPSAVALLSVRAAERYFGTSKAAGKRVYLHTYGDTVSVLVVAVFENFPDNTHDKFDVLLRSDAGVLRALQFGSGELSVYGRAYHRFPGQFALREINRAGSNDFRYSLQPLPDVYFGARVLGEEAAHGDRYSIAILLCITALILVLAVATYINLTTLTLPHRAKELAVKKLAGERSRSLLFDFLRESAVVVGGAFLLAILGILGTSRYWQTLLDVDTHLLFWQLDGAFIFALVVLVIATTVAPLGLMRRFVQASPSRLLGADTITFPRLKNIMAFLQLGTGIFLIAASVVVGRQINYSLVKEPGTNHDQVVYLECPRDITAQGVAHLRAQWRRTSANIVDVMAVSHLPDRIGSKEVGSQFYVLHVDPGFREFFDLRMEHGNWFKANDGDSIIVTNEVGEALLGTETRNVIGVMEDPARLFHQPSKPLKIQLEGYQTFNWLCVRVLEVDIRRTMRELALQFGSDDEPASVRYLNTRFASWIKYQDQLNSLSEILAMISITLSCISIYGLSVSIVREKSKQIAVHRLFGARTARLTYLLARAFATQVLAALIIFGPLIYIALQELLRIFVYATKLRWTDALYPVGYCVAVILLVCLFQALSLNRSDFVSRLKQT
ncbi:MAG: ABC transporter permease [Chryseolinea sp.]